MSPQSYTQIADQLVRRGRLVGDAASLAPTVSAAIRADHRRRERARFRYVEGRVALVDWYLPRDAVRQEKDVIRFAERQRDQVRRAFLTKVQALPAAGFVEILATWLNAEGISGLRAVRRPGSGAQEIHLAGVLRRGPEETRVAVVLLRSGTEIPREKVVELRGSLHHYGTASTGWIVSTGPLSRAAREEASVAGTTPIALFDGLALAEAMESRRIGLVPVSIPVSAIDLDLLDALRGTPERIERGVDRDRDRGDRDRDRDRGDRDRDRNDRDRDRDRGDRDRDRDRGAEEPRGEQPVAAEAEAETEAAPTGEAGEGSVEVVGVEGGAPAQGEAGGEGGRRKRRRRRRGRGQGESLAPGAVEGGEGESDEGAEGEEAEEAAASAEPSGEPSDESEDVPDSDDERVAIDLVEDDEDLEHERGMAVDADGGREDDVERGHVDRDRGVDEGSEREGEG